MPAPAYPGTDCGGDPVRFLLKAKRIPCERNFVVCTPVWVVETKSLSCLP